MQCCTSTSNAYYLNFTASSTYPSYSTTRWYGYAVRCAATGSYIRNGAIPAGWTATPMFFGENGYHGVATTSMTNARCDFAFNGSIIIPAEIGNKRIYAFPLRCLAW